MNGIIASATHHLLIPPGSADVPAWFGDTIAGVINYNGAGSVWGGGDWYARAWLQSLEGGLPTTDDVMWLQDAVITIVKLEGGGALLEAGAIATEATKRNVVRGKDRQSGRSGSAPGFGGAPPGVGPGIGTT